MDPLRVNLTIKTGFSIRSGYGLTGIFDEIIVRDPKGFPYIPGSTLKGIVRQGCEELYLVKGYQVFKDVVSEVKTLIPDKDLSNSDNLCDKLSGITRIFGSPFCPSLFEFHSAYLDPLKNEEEAIKILSTWCESHNTICRETGTAMSKHLFTYEIASGDIKMDGIPGYQFSFDIVPKKAEIDEHIVSLLICGIRFVDRIGANKSRGKGVVEMKIPESYGGRKLAEWINITFPFQETGS